MKRTKIIMAFLLCACLIVGVGYAAVVDILDVNGTAEYGLEHNIDKEIYFQSAYSYDNDNTASVSSTNNDKITFSVNTLSSTSNVAFFRFEVHNKHDAALKFYLSSYGISGTGNPGTYYDVRYLISDTNHDTLEASAFNDYKDAENEKGEANGITIPASEGDPQVRYVYVAVKLKADPGVNIVTATFALEFAADEVTP